MRLVDDLCNACWDMPLSEKKLERVIGRTDLRKLKKYLWKKCSFWINSSQWKFDFWYYLNEWLNTKIWFFGKAVYRNVYLLLWCIQTICFRLIHNLIMRTIIIICLGLKKIVVVTFFPLNWNIHFSKYPIF